MLKDDIENLEKAIQALTSAQSNVSEAYSHLDNESVNVLMTASSLIIAIANQKSEEMNKLILKDENNFKSEQNCQKSVRCFICGKREYGGCPA